MQAVARLRHFPVDRRFAVLSRTFDLGTHVVGAGLAAGEGECGDNCEKSPQPRTTPPRFAAPPLLTNRRGKTPCGQINPLLHIGGVPPVGGGVVWPCIDVRHGSLKLRGTTPAGCARHPSL